jgi:hypothetical protein
MLNFEFLMLDFASQNFEFKILDFAKQNLIPHSTFRIPHFKRNSLPENRGNAHARHAGRAGWASRAGHT